MLVIVVALVVLLVGAGWARWRFLSAEFKFMHHGGLWRFSRYQDDMRSDGNADGSDT